MSEQSTETRATIAGKQEVAPQGGATVFSAAMDIYEKDGTLHIRVDVPGMAENDVQVEIAPGRVSVSGEKSQERSVSAENYYHSERTYGAFNRQVALPQTADVAQAKRQLKNGVLEIDIPLKQ